MDRKCAFRGLPRQGSVLTLYSGPEGMSHKGLQNLWQPDTHFLNAKSSSKSEVVTWIKNIGLVETRTRFAVTTSCPMDLRLFPMDRQMCSLVIQGCPKGLELEQSVALKQPTTHRIGPF